MAQRGYRWTIEAIGELPDYSMRGAGICSGHADRLLPLRRYLIASICTLARRDAILDMNAEPAPRAMDGRRAPVRAQSSGAITD